MIEWHHREFIFGVMKGGTSSHKTNFIWKENAQAVIHMHQTLIKIRN